jgi:uncharacterized zinc-type alcohol dehydrogenase-like protein
MIKTRGYAASQAKVPLAPFNFDRRDVGERDVLLEILYCGICHSDIHQARDEWGGSVFPMVPGHEIVGRVTKVGSAVRKVKVGDLAGVGCMVDSCRTCASCEEGLEQYCQTGAVFTYNSVDKATGKPTFGGYSDKLVVDEAFTLRVSDKLNPAAVAPLLCAGITTYSPLRHWRIGEGHRVGVVGLGGLGHMGVKFARAMGAHVVCLTTSAKKRADAERLGAHEVVLSTDKAAMKGLANSLDFVLNTVSAPHDYDEYLRLLRLDGAMVLVGLPEKDQTISAFSLISKRRQLGGSLIGGIAETQEMLDYCAEQGIVSDVEVIPIQGVNEAYERMLRGDVKYRFVIDMASLKG